MNLDDWMAVRQSQDAAPLHDVNKTLLHQALRQDEARLQKERRIEKWIIYVASAGIVAGMALGLSLMILLHGQAPEKHSGVTVWDYVMGIGGAAAALLTVGALYVGHRAQARREQRFGESLRDHINRRIAQLDDAATGGRRRSLLILVALGGIWPTAIIYLGARISGKTTSDVLYLIPALIIWGLWSGTRGLRRSRRSSLLVLVLVGAIYLTAIFYLSGRINGPSIGSPSYLIIALLIWCLWAGTRGVRRSVQRDLSRKRRLEALLKELDGQ